MTTGKATAGSGLFGYPLSEEYQEISATDGKTYTVQYFERQTLRVSPRERARRIEVLLGLLGTYHGTGDAPMRLRRVGRRFASNATRST